MRFTSVSALVEKFKKYKLHLRGEKGRRKKGFNYLSSHGRRKKINDLQTHLKGREKVVFVFIS